MLFGSVCYKNKIKAHLKFR